MASDVIDDYQQLSNQLDDASTSLQKVRKERRAKKAKEVAPTIEEAAVELHSGVAESEGERAPEAPKRKGRRAAAAAVSAEESHPDGPVTADDAGDESGDDSESGEKGDAGHGHLIDGPTLEALLFTTRHPLTPARIGELVDVPSVKALRAAIAALNETYEKTGRSFRIEQVAGGYQMLTLPHYGQLLNKLHQREIDSKLTRSALETLSIIAYKQPVLRAEVEAIRGVASGETIRTLMEKHLVKIAGRAEIAGRPILYGTTKRFLEVFGLNSLKELPKEDQARPLPPHANAVGSAGGAHTPDHSLAAETSDAPAEVPAAEVEISAEEPASA